MFNPRINLKGAKGRSGHCVGADWIFESLFTTKILSKDIYVWTEILKKEVWRIETNSNNKQQLRVAPLFWTDFHAEFIIAAEVLIIPLML